MGTDVLFAIDFDFVDHRLVVHSSTGRTGSFPLVGLSVAAFHAELLRTLAAVGVVATIDRPVPYGLADEPLRPAVAT